MVQFLPPVLMGEARQQQQVVLCWDTRTTQPCTPLVTGVRVCVGEGTTSVKHQRQFCSSYFVPGY